ncbi:hypothetical protein [Sphingomonas sp. PAMC 26605]|uniref:hypothetical protein n=1 Tax=Sphingomonas sp. PAMC 26605 TaxID=1112214 RepID=UPI00026CD00F|nr:hypothetical protein [Sphingomonas sp. PAMC 26605]
MQTRDVLKRKDRDQAYWFAPHVFGIGATPVTWQGWAVTIGFCALLMLVVRFVHERIAQVGVEVALLLVFTMIVIRKTEGGLRWRWGTGG